MQRGAAFDVMIQKNVSTPEIDPVCFAGESQHSSRNGESRDGCREADKYCRFPPCMAPGSDKNAPQIITAKMHARGQWDRSSDTAPYSPIELKHNNFRGQGECEP